MLLRKRLERINVVLDHGQYIMGPDTRTRGKIMEFTGQRIV